MTQEHGFASPTPAGLGALAIAVFGFAAYFLGLVDVNGLPLLAAWLIAGFVVQVVVGVAEMKNQNLTGGNVFLFFSAFFMLAAALSIFMKWYMISFMFGPKAAKDALDAAAVAYGSEGGHAFARPDQGGHGWRWPCHWRNGAQSRPC